jgi:hypothetical protein
MGAAASTFPQRVHYPRRTPKLRGTNEPWLLAGRHDRAAENDAYVDITRTLRSIGLTGEVTYGLRAGRGFIFLFSGSIMARRPLYCIYRVRPSGA